MLPNPLETADLVKFTEEILNGKLRFLCTVHATHFHREIRMQSKPGYYCTFGCEVIISNFMSIFKG